MKNMSLEKIAQACGGVYHGSEEMKQSIVESITTDSRQAAKGCLFVAIPGERVDGHDFIPSVFEKGALAVLSEKELENPAGPYIQVASSLEAVKGIAEYYRQQLDIKVVGITGSVGKTSTKEVIASVLAQKYNVLKTLGNFNNELGLPLTVFRLRDEHQIAVLEMGISHFGEMHRLAKVWRLRKANRHGSVVLSFFFITFYNKSGVMGNFATEPSLCRRRLYRFCLAVLCR